LRPFLARRVHDDAALVVDLPGHLQPLLARVAEELLEHGDHVVEAVIVVVVQDDVVRRLGLRLLLLLFLQAPRRPRDGDGFGHDLVPREGPVPSPQAVCRCYTDRLKHATVMSSCCLQPSACCLPALTTRSAIALGVNGPGRSAVYTPSI